MRDDARLARWALYDRLESMLTLLLAELENQLSPESYSCAKMFVEHAEYGLALERIAFDVVSLDGAWNRDLFAKIAEAMGSTGPEYLEEARRVRRRSSLDQS